MKAQTPFKGADYIYWYQLSVGKTNGALTTPSAWLEIGKDSTNKGIRLPRVVDTANVSAPVYGLQVYQIKDNSVYFRDKTGWRRQIDANIIHEYLPKADSMIYYYPFWSNPRGYISNELDPVANAKTVRWLSGTGITVSNNTAQPLSGNPVATISAQNTAALWNANQLQSIPISATPPTSGQVLQYDGSQYIPSTPPPSGTVSSVGLSLPSTVFNVTGSPVTSTGTLSGSLKPQFANLFLASPPGISGVPTFRSLDYSDFPLSGVTPGIYGNDTISPKITVSDKGIITSAGISNLSGQFVRTQNVYAQAGGFHIAGTGQAGKFYTSGASYRAIQSNLIDSTQYVTWDFLNNNKRVAYLGWVKLSSSNPMLSIGTVNYVGREYPMIRLMDSTRVIIGDTTQFSPPVTDDGINTLQVNGTVRTTTMPAYSSGGVLPIGRNVTTGRFETISSGGGVSSVGLSMPSEFAVSSSPVTSAGTLTVTKSNQAPNTIYAGPTGGGSAQPTFRSLTRNDISKANNITAVNDADYSINSTDDIIIFSSVITANRTITLPSAGTNTGRFLYITVLEMNPTFSVSPSPSILLNSGTIITGFGNNSSSTIYSDGSNWRLLHESTH
jgi:hypothetical protein